MSKQEDLEERLWDLIESEDPLSCGEVEEVYRISYELGRASVYNENGWGYFDED